MASSEDTIRNLLYRYTHAMDEGDFEAAAGLFANARILVAEPDVALGAEEMLEMWRAMVIVYPDCGTPKTRHLCTNAVIEVDEAGNSARAESYYTVYQQTDSLPLQVIAMGRYHDEFVRVDGVWRFSQRDYRMLDMVGDTSQHLRSA